MLRMLRLAALFAGLAVSVFVCIALLCRIGIAAHWLAWTIYMVTTKRIPYVTMTYVTPEGEKTYMSMAAFTKYIRLKEMDDMFSSMCMRGMAALEVIALMLLL